MISYYVKLYTPKYNPNMKLLIKLMQTHDFYKVILGSLISIGVYKFSAIVGVRAEGKAALAITTNQRIASKIKVQHQAHSLASIPFPKT